jgi:hypothetical protein
MLAAVTMLIAQLPQSLESYRLTMANIRKMAAAYGRIDAALQAKPALAKSMAHAKGATSPEELVARFDKDPVISKAIGWAGISSRDFVFTQLAMFTTRITAAAIEAGGMAPTAPAAVANLQLYKQNRAEIEQISARIKALPSWQMLQTESGDDDDDE